METGWGFVPRDLANWVIQCAQTWLKPHRQMRKALPEETVIYADETVVQVLKEDGKPATSESRMWVYASGRYSQKQIRSYQPDRSGKHPARLLKDSHGSGNRWLRRVQPG